MNSFKPDSNNFAMYIRVCQGQEFYLKFGIKTKQAIYKYIFAPDASIHFLHE